MGEAAYDPQAPGEAAVYIAIYVQVRPEVLLHWKGCACGLGLYGFSIGAVAGLFAQGKTDCGTACVCPGIIQLGFDTVM